MTVFTAKIEVRIAPISGSLDAPAPKSRRLPSADQNSPVFFLKLEAYASDYRMSLRKRMLSDIHRGEFAFLRLARCWDSNEVLLITALQPMVGILKD